MVWAFSSHCALWAHLTPSHTGLSLTRGHQWILSAARLLIFKSLLFLNNLFSDLLICFSIPHVQSTASTEICSAFKKMTLFYKISKASHRGLCRCHPQPKLSHPTLPAAHHTTSFHSGIWCRGQIGKLGTPSLMLSGKKLWEHTFTTDENNI